MDFFTSRCVRFLLACCSHSVLVKCSILHRRLCVHLCDVQKGVTTSVVYAVIYASRALYDQHGVTIAVIPFMLFCWCGCCLHSSFHFQSSGLLELHPTSSATATLYVFFLPESLVECCGCWQRRMSRVDGSAIGLLILSKRLRNRLNFSISP